MSLTLLSFGGGQDSTAILYRLIDEPSFRAKSARGQLVVVMSATGNEHPDTDAHVESCKRLCAAAGVAFEHLTFDRGYHSGSWSQGLVGFYKAKNAIGSVAYPKTCSDNLKIQPIRRWLKEFCGRAIGRDLGAESVKTYVAWYGKIHVLLGIAKGEESRVASTDRSKWAAACLVNEYPLIDEGWGRTECQAYLQRVSGSLPPPSNCVFCPFKSHIEILWTARRYPEQFAVWVDLERRKLQANAHMSDRNYGVKKRTTLPQVLATAERDHGHLSTAQLDQYRMSHGHCVKTTF